MVSLFAVAQLLLDLGQRCAFVGLGGAVEHVDDGGEVDDGCDDEQVEGDACPHPPTHRPTAALDNPVRNYR